MRFVLSLFGSSYFVCSDLVLCSALSVFFTGFLKLRDCKSNLKCHFCYGVNVCSSVFVQQGQMVRLGQSQSSLSQLGQWIK